MARVDEDVNIDRPYALLLPRIGFELTGMRYNPERHLNMTNITATKDNADANRLRRQFQSVAWDFDFNVYVMVKNAEDGTKIIEQILPFFTPAWTATLNLLPEMGLSLDIPIDLKSVQIEDNYDGAFTVRRAMIYTLQFTVQGYLFQPIVSKPIIKFSKMQFYIPNTNADIGTAIANTDMIGQLTVTPGLLANGAPTSNSTLSVSPNIIEIDDDFGFCIDNTGIILNE